MASTGTGTRRTLYYDEESECSEDPPPPPPMLSSPSGKNYEEETTRQEKADNLKSQGNKLMAAQQYMEAYDAYSRALKECPDGPQSHIYLSNRAASLLSMKKYEEAKWDAELAIELSPDFAKAHARLGQALYFLKRYPESIEAYLVAMELEPDNSVTVLYWNKARKKLEKLEKRRQQQQQQREQGLEEEEPYAFNDDESSEPLQTLDEIPEEDEQIDEDKDDDESTYFNFETEVFDAASFGGFPNVENSVEYDRNDFLGNFDIDTEKNENVMSPEYKTGNPVITPKNNLIDESRPFDEPEFEPTLAKEPEENFQKRDSDDEDDDPDFEKALKLQQKANLLLDRKQYRAAVEEFSVALFLVPDDYQLTPQLYLGRSEALLGLGRYNGTKQDAIAALQFQPLSFELYSILGRALMFLREWEAGVEALERAQELAKNEGGDISKLDKAYLEKGREAFFEETMNDDDINDMDEDAKSHFSTGSSLQSHLTGEKNKNKRIPKLKPPRFVSRSQVLQSPLNTPLPPKNWAVSLAQGDPSIMQKHVTVLRLGTERSVTFVSEQLGIKLNRASDGIIRVVSVSEDNHFLRNGTICAGDVVREAVGVDLRRPITNVMWGDTVALMKMAPRPIELIVAEEKSKPPPDAAKELAKNSDSYQVSRDREQVIYAPSPSNGEEPVDKATSGSCMQQINDDDNVSSIPEIIADNDNANEMKEITTSSPIQTIPVDDIENVNDTELTDNGNETDAEKSCFVSKNLDSEEPVEMLSTDLDKKSKPGNNCQETKLGVVVDSNIESNGNNDESQKVDNEKIQNEKNMINIEHDTSTDSKVKKKEQTPNEFSTEVIPTTSEDQIDVALFGEQPNKMKEILFSRKNNSHWTNEKWLATSATRELVRFGTLRQHLKGNRFLWWGDHILEKLVAIYSRPNLILVLRNPQSLAEVRQLLGIPKELEVGNNEIFIDSFLVVDHVFEPQMCKLRLSLLTTPTSISQSSLEEEKNVNAKSESTKNSSCFELITPKESFFFSSKKIQKEENDNANTAAFEDTSNWEASIIQFLESGFIQGRKEKSTVSDFDNVWLHQIVLGSLHSHVLSGNFNILEKALSIAKTYEKKEGVLKNYVNELDKVGLTALHYACASRSSKIVSLLVSAGADCLFPTPLERKTPCHLSSEYLDEKSLSVILASTYPSRPDPNALDYLGHTPMYLASVHGKSVGGGCDPTCLGMCISALEAWGGQMFVPRDEFIMTRPDLQFLPPHPIYSLACGWKESELKVLLSHCNFRYPLTNQNTYVIGKEGISLSASYHYPIHASLISLRIRISKFRETGSINGFDDFSAKPPLFRTIAVLLKHGFEPNERIESLEISGDHCFQINHMVGFTPLQILGAAVLDWIELMENFANDETKYLSQNIVDRFSFCIESVAELLLTNGARINVDFPPLYRQGRKVRLSELSSKSAQNLSNLPSVERLSLRVDKHPQVIEFFGGEQKIRSAEESWLRTSKSIRGSNKILLHTKKGSILDSLHPGGSDSKSCAICWKSFGLVTNRKHHCRASNRYVCEDCSSRCLLERGEAFRVSDGQFSLAKADLQEYNDLRDERLNAKRKERLERSKEISQKRLDDRITLGEAFGRIGTSVKNLFLEEVETSEGFNANHAEGLKSTLGQTQDALHERGDKLNNLSEKTDALRNASLDFATMAKELNEKQSSGLFW